MLKLLLVFKLCFMTKWAYFLGIGFNSDVILISNFAKFNFFRPSKDQLESEHDKIVALLNQILTDRAK